MSGSKKRQPLDGILLLDKAAGWSSNQALKKAQHLLNAAKAGHCGTLDPLATGLLPIVLGEATKFANDLLGADKTYLASLCLGVRTDTGDAEGRILARRPVELDRDAWDRVVATFVGEIEQVPPMFSALKRDGKPLYEYAREGIELERQARTVRIHSLNTEGFVPPGVTIRVRCSKGTYIRTLADDIGEALGCGAHLSALRREGIATLNVVDAVGIDTLLELQPEGRLEHVRPLDSLLQGLPVRILDAQQSSRFRQGQRIRISAANDHLGAASLVRIYALTHSPDRLIGIANEYNGLLAPQRVLNTNSFPGEHP